MFGTIVNGYLFGAGVLALFVSAVVADWCEHPVAPYVASAAWITFAGFWGNLIEYFALVHQSIIETVLVILAVPLCLYLAYHAARNTPPVSVLTRAITIMGVVYLPAVALPTVQAVLIETVAAHAHILVQHLGYHPSLVVGDAGLRNTFEATTDGTRYGTKVVLACTGIGSMSIIAGLIAAVRAPLHQKFIGLAVALPLIWILNVLRVAFIVLAHSYQWFTMFSAEVMWLFGESDPTAVSYLIADRIIAQSLSVVALLALLFLLTRLIPNLGPFLINMMELLLGNDTDTTTRTPDQ